MGHGRQAKQIHRGVVRQKGHTSIWQHSCQGRRETPIEVDQTSARDRDGCVSQWYRWHGRSRRLLMVDLAADPRQAGPLRVLARLKGQAHADHLEGVGQEDGCHARDGTGEYAAPPRFLGG